MRYKAAAIENHEIHSYSLWQFIEPTNWPGRFVLAQLIAPANQCTMYGYTVRKQHDSKVDRTLTAQLVNQETWKKQKKKKRKKKKTLHYYYNSSCYTVNAARNRPVGRACVLMYRSWQFSMSFSISRADRVSASLVFKGYHWFASIPIQWK